MPPLHFFSHKYSHLFQQFSDHPMPSGSPISPSVSAAFSLIVGFSLFKASLSGFMALLPNLISARLVFHLTVWFSSPRCSINGKIALSFPISPRAQTDFERTLSSPVSRALIRGRTAGWLFFQVLQKPSIEHWSLNRLKHLSKDQQLVPLQYLQGLRLLCALSLHLHLQALL